MMGEGDLGSRAIQRAGNGLKAVRWVVTVDEGSQDRGQSQQISVQAQFPS